MSEVHSVADDLAFVRGAVDRRDRQRPDLFGVYLAWAFYVVIGYALIDYRPAWANLFFAVAWIPATLAGIASVRRQKARGEVLGDPDLARRSALHWGGGIVLALAAGIGLSLAVPTLRGPVSGQLIVCLIGVVYFLGGVHFDRRFLVLGPIMIAGGIAISFVHFLPWTMLGLIIGVGLVVPSFFKRAESAEANHVQA